MYVLIAPMQAGANARTSTPAVSHLAALEGRARLVCRVRVFACGRQPLAENPVSVLGRWRGKAIDLTKNWLCFNMLINLQQQK